MLLFEHGREVEAVDPSVFREYDIRGTYPDQLSEAEALRLGRAIATVVRASGGRMVAVGRDNRPSSPALAGSLVEGLAAGGCHVLDLGTVLTPILYYADRLYATHAAVMVTASHNPPEFNGFKVVSGGATLFGEQIRELGRLAASGRFVQGQGTVEHRDPVPAYLAELERRIRLESGRRLRVACDCGNGTASLFAPEVLQRWGCEVIPLYCTPDPGFPNHHPDPTRLANLRDLVATVRREGADLGVAFDGDGDRLGVVDDRGRVVWGDMLLALFWQEVLPRFPGTPALVEVKCSQALIDVIRRLGGEPEFTRTGHSLIKARMKELGAVLAGEMSGHFFFADEYFGFDDALYAAGRLLRLLARDGRPLSALVSALPRYWSTPEIRVDCPEACKAAAVRAVAAHFTGRFPIVTVDGARVLFPEGWGLVRASNTQPVLVVRAEGRSRRALDAVKAELAVALREAGLGEVDWDG